MSRMAKTEGRRRRWRFSDGFRAGAVRLALEEGRTGGAVACELDLTESALPSWVARARADRTKVANDGGSAVMTLFDSMVRTRMAPARRREPHYEYSNASARADIASLRTMAEAWFWRARTRAAPAVSLNCLALTRAHGDLRADERGLLQAVIASRGHADTTGTVAGRLHGEFVYSYSPFYGSAVYLIPITPATKEWWAGLARPRYALIDPQQNSSIGFQDQTTVARDGGFAFHNVAPGEYYLYGRVLWAATARDTTSFGGDAWLGTVNVVSGDTARVALRNRRSFFSSDTGPSKTPASP